MFFKRQKEGSVLCPSCGNLVGVNDEQCFTCGRRNPSMWGFAGAIRALGRDLGFVQLVITSCTVLFVATLLIDMDGIGMGGFLDLLSPSGEALALFGMSGALPVFVDGHWWTLLSAGWLHGSVIHILFNMMWVRNLAPATAELYGAGRMVIIYVISSAAGFFQSSLMGYYFYRIPFLGGAPYTIGASAAIFGLLGALVYYGRRTGHSAVHRQMVGYAILLGAFGLLVPGVDNQAHLGGFLGGYITARILDPLEPERGDHLAVAVVCLVLSAASIVVSLVVGLGRVLG